MLISLLLTLQADQNGVLPQSVGRANYAVTLARLNELTAGLGDVIHAQAGLKPLTCSGLFAAHGPAQAKPSAGQPAEFQTVVRAGERFYIHLTGLTQTVSKALNTAFIEQPPATWSVSDFTFRVVKTLCNAQVDPWTGCTTYEALATKPILQGGPFAPQVTLAFLSPTSVQSNAQHMPLPLPNLVFGSLVDRWNHFSPLVKLPAELRTRLGERVAISQYELRSQAVTQKSGKNSWGGGQKAIIVGAEGYATYTLLNRDDDPYKFADLLGKLQTLANFALYSGIGVKTTTGMGQCRRVIRC